MSHRGGLLRLWSEDGSQIVDHQLSTAVANIMLANGIAGWYRNRQGKLRGLRIITPPQQSSRAPSLFSTPSISLQETISNSIGAFTPSLRKFGLNAHDLADEMIVGNIVDQGMTKTEAWPFLGDGRAIRVVPVAALCGAG
jgi:hypothetical protein